LSRCGAVQMARRIVFAMARQIDGKNGVPPGKRFHIPAPAERSAQQSMQQQERPPRSSAKVVDLFPVDLCRNSIDLHGL
jgi:hypothetical protein